MNVTTNALKTIVLCAAGLPALANAGTISVGSTPFPITPPASAGNVEPIGGGIALQAQPTSIQLFPIQVQPSSTSIALGDTFAVQFTAVNFVDYGAPSLGAFDINVDFNSSVIRYSSMTWGNQLDILGFGSVRSFDSTQAQSGHLNSYEVSLDDPADLDSLQAGNFVLFTLNFTAIDTGRSTLDLGINDLSDSRGVSLSSTSISTPGIEVNAVPVPAALPLFASALLALTRLRMRRRA